ncbi:CAZyme family GT25 [Aspergillus niger]|nr:CAZyme family GT25 [Aspergillus niger]
MILSSPQKRFGRLVLYVLGVFVILLILWPLPYARVTARKGAKSSWTQLDAIKNETLGVQKIFAINLPGRVDKRDNLVLGSSVSEFNIDWVDGVTPDELDPKTYPYNWNYDHKPTEYAARRAHVNAMQRIVKERIRSAIVMEDDVDWDVTLKTQLQSFALGLRTLQGVDQNVTASPYGDDWDIIWLGHCGVECRTDAPFFVSHNDPTVLPPHHYLPYWRDPPPVKIPDYARLTCAVNDGVCSIVYAVSYHAAQKILAALSVNPTGIAEKIDIGAQFDVSLGRMCGSGFLQCFAAFPSLTGGYIPAGPSSKGSDIHGGNEDVHPISSHGVMYSTMLNINRMLNGEGTVTSNWDDAPAPVISPTNISVTGGEMHMLKEDSMYTLAVVNP